MKSSVKKHKKAIIIGFVFVSVVVGLGFGYMQSPYAQFKKFCDAEEAVCSCAQGNLTLNEKRAFIDVARDIKENKKITPSNQSVKSLDLQTAGAKIRACTAKVKRDVWLNQIQNNSQFPGNYVCMQQAIINALSNDEVLFLQSPQSRTLAGISANNGTLNLYISGSNKIMPCMSSAVQAQYKKELEQLRQKISEAKN